MVTTDVVIVLSDCLESSKKAFNSVINSTKVKRIILVDNNSQEKDTQDWLKSLNNSCVNEKAIQVIFRSSNDGFANAVNEAVNYIESEFVIFMHNDTEFYEGSIENMLESAFSLDKANIIFMPTTNQPSSCSFVGNVGRGNYSSNMDCSSKETIDLWIGEYQRSNKLLTKKVYQLSSFAFGLKTSFMKEIIDKRGFLLNPEYGLGPFEDIDLGRYVLSLEGEILVCFGSYAHHKSGETYKCKNIDYNALAKKNEEIFRRVWDKEQKIAAIVFVNNINYLSKCIEQLIPICNKIYILTGIKGTRNAINRLLSKNKDKIKVVSRVSNKNINTIRQKIFSEIKNSGIDWIIDTKSSNIFEEDFIENVNKIVNPINLQIKAYLMKNYYLCCEGKFYLLNDTFDKSYFRMLYKTNFSPTEIESLAFLDTKVKDLTYFTEKKIKNLIKDDKTKLKIFKSKKDIKKVASVSLVMIVKDEIKELKRALQSAQGLYDELIVVWSGKNPRTEKLLKSFNAKIIKIKWKNDFAYARNIGINAATKEWIFWLDADEFLENGSVEKWRKILNDSEALKISALKSDLDKNYKIRQQTFYERAFRNFYSMKFYGRVHEYIISPKYYSVDYARLNIFHYGYNVKKVHKEKILRNTKILLKELRKMNDHRYYIYYLEILLKKEKYSQVVALYEKLVKNRKLSLTSTGFFFATITASKSYLAIGKPQKALDCLSRLISANNLWLDTYVHMGIIFQKMGLDKNALLSFEIANHLIEKGEVFTVLFDEKNLVIMSIMYLIALLLKFGNLKDAENRLNFLKNIYGNEDYLKEFFSSLENFFSNTRNNSLFDNAIVFPNEKATDIFYDKFYEKYPIIHLGVPTLVRLPKISL